MDQVIDLAERLQSDGVFCRIDKWDLKEGHDKYSFMEEMVKSDDINKVLLILDEKYAEKADNREGGVGTETQIITHQIYEDVTQDKFIPVIFQKDGDGQPYLPIFLKSRIYIDLSPESQYEENYEKLIRNIFNKPEYSRPKLGTPPKFLFDEVPNNYKTRHLLRSFPNAIANDNHVDSRIKEFLEEFISHLKEFSIDFNNLDESECSKAVHESIIQFRTLREDFLAFFNFIGKEKVHFDIDIMIKFLEELTLLNFPLNTSQWYPIQYDNFRFITHEIFLYLIAFSLKNENYQLISDLFYSQYFLYNHHGEKKKANFVGFYSNITTIDDYYHKIHQQRYISPMADLLIKNISPTITKEIFIEADLLCHYISRFNNITHNDFTWYPLTSVYRNPYGTWFDFFERLNSKRHFEKVKCIFDVQTLDEFKEKFSKFKLSGLPKAGRQYPGEYENVLPLTALIDIENVATAR